MATQRREIDTTEGSRTTPMRVLVLGMPRTGTTSLTLALRKLGYNPYTMRNMLSTPRHIALWQEATELTLLHPSPHGNSLAYTKPDFDKLLGANDSVTDLPTAVFAKELIEAYPDAKVILSTREYEAWEKEMQNSMWIFFTWELFNMARSIGITQMAPVMNVLHKLFEAHNGNAYGGPRAKAAFEKHNQTIRDLVPASQLLEFTPEQGWQELCPFLDVEVPDARFPRVDEGKQLREGLERQWWLMVRYLVLMIVAPGLVVLVAWVYWTYQDYFWGFLDEVLARLAAFMGMSDSEWGRSVDQGKSEL
ncbi:hypothetical protein BDV96DRAFT_605330 [Lophiotrema nucula]|uniref:P-loop containing nucleoside triphosphate hydrolase protein n=1 Tax=Lophiotrema nucula TaxID=690887 RepID=A0A6A5YRX2_9PLEO|nr:hypothetical protein BDV96DRAFT_605330 [Lophiotrema nucula]